MTQGEADGWAAMEAEIAWLKAELAQARAAAFDEAIKVVEEHHRSAWLTRDVGYVLAALRARKEGR